jgi:hypothetical protein
MAAMTPDELFPKLVTLLQDRVDGLPPDERDNPQRDLEAFKKQGLQRPVDQPAFDLQHLLNATAPAAALITCRYPIGNNLFCIHNVTLEECQRLNGTPVESCGGLLPY